MGSMRVCWFLSFTSQKCYRLLRKIDWDNGKILGNILRRWGRYVDALTTITSHFHCFGKKIPHIDPSFVTQQTMSERGRQPHMLWFKACFLCIFTIRSACQLDNTSGLLVLRCNYATWVVWACFKSASLFLGNWNPQGCLLEQWKLKAMVRSIWSWQLYLNENIISECHVHVSCLPVPGRPSINLGRFYIPSSYEHIPTRPSEPFLTKALVTTFAT